MGTWCQCKKPRAKTIPTCPNPKPNPKSKTQKNKDPKPKTQNSKAMAERERDSKPWLGDNLNQAVTNDSVGIGVADLTMTSDSGRSTSRI